MFCIVCTEKAALLSGDCVTANSSSALRSPTLPTSDDADSLQPWYQCWFFYFPACCRLRKSDTVETDMYGVLESVLITPSDYTLRSIRICVGKGESGGPDDGSENWV